MSSSRPYYRYLSLLISICLSLEFITIPVANAAPSEAERAPQKNVPIVADVGEIPNKLPKTKLELTSKRTKYSTRYLNPNGTFTEEIFSEPEFYQDKADKKWKKIDNNLKANTKKKGKHKNTANDFTASVADEADGTELVSAEKDGKSLALVPVQASKVKAEIKGNEITYPSLYLEVDARYHVLGGAVKEDLILNSAAAQNAFSYEIKLDGLKAATDKKGMIIFTDSKGKEQWFFAKPFMTDANGKHSDKVTLSLREEGGKTYVDITADQAFLKDPATKFPVTMDPTVNNWDVQRDNFVSGNYPNSYSSSDASMYAGYDSFYGWTRSLLKFYLPVLPSDSSITNASFSAFQTKAYTTNTSISLSRITSDWNSYVAWNTQPTIKTTAESTVTSNTSNGYWQWDITQLAKDWYNNSQPNYGFMLKQQSETAASNWVFNTVNSGTNTLQLTVNYTVDPIGVEDFWGYSQDGVNVANGNLVVDGTDVSTPGRGVPVSVSRVYNSRKSGVAGMFGYGWSSNVEARLADGGTGPITLIDGDNNRHIFGENTSGGYIAAGGVYLTLDKNADGTYTITQKDGTKINFNTSGKIASFVDTNGNTTTLGYDAAGKLTTITDATKRITTISYGTNGYVSSIADPANRTTSYAYDAAGNLITVTGPAGMSTTLAYDAAHNLTGVTDARNIKTTLTYDASDRVASVSRPITVNGVVQTSTTSYSYDTVNRVTSVTDGEGKQIDYTYDPSDRLTQVTENPLDAANQVVTKYTYDNENNLTQVLAPKGQAYVYQYEKGKGNLTIAQRPDMKQIIYTYDNQNNVVWGQDFNNNVSTSDYDAKNNQTESIDPAMSASADRYEPSGLLEYSTEPMSAADNLAVNTSFELGSATWPDHWDQLTETGKTATYAWSTISKVGNKSISISNPTGWAVARSDQMALYTPGEQYIVSGYVKTDNTTGKAS
ncbi:DNRLRE domain-containing protein [Aneurinibacillus tyrosinisolvens]|uniref:DNRLRE domain-containing protein n=1 Tax=Aneurinibacillus tyrosinisolvens TaxID=1443435 RepID=UPI00069A5122|nr:DNRLRE domain-containing protein [Aneurinibacillus tyrosinisolvens]